MRSQFALPLLAAIASAQVIDPSTVSIADRNQWCLSQKTSCPILCTQETGSGTVSANTCEAKTLDWACVCANGLSPNVSEYSQTVPYFQCTESNNQCVKNCGQNNACSSACRENNPCGAKDPTRVNSSSIAPTSTSAGSSGTGGAAATSGSFDSFGGNNGNGGGQAQQTGSSGSSAGVKLQAISLGQTYGFAAICAGLFAGFGLML